MKKLIFAAALAFSCFAYQASNAQIRASVNINIGSQPDWGPVGYDQANYYYMPDIDTYYDVPAHQYVYFQNNRWIRAASLPGRYSNYDLYNGYKVVVNQSNPWNRADYYRSQYASYRNRRGQAVIRDSRDSRYQNHWNGPGNNGRGNAYGHYKNNGNDHGRGNGNGRGRGNGHY
jgi:hypothetical protein